MKDILVTGGSGFIASHTINELLKRGYSVISFDRVASPKTVEATISTIRFHGHHPILTRFTGDIRDKNSVDEAVRNCDGVINLAGLLGTAEAVDDPFPAAETNIFGALNVLAAIRKYDKPMVQIAVGNHFENNTYSISKTTAERFALMYAKEHESRVVVVRGLNVYGPGQHHKPIRKIMPNFIVNALRGDPIKVYGTGDQVMDMIWCEDIARVLVSALEVVEQHKIPGVLEAGTGRPTTVNEIAEIVVKTALELYKPIPEGSYPIHHVPMRRGESKKAIVLGNPETLGVIGINKRHFKKLEDGVKLSVKWYYDNYEWKKDKQITSDSAVLD